MQPATVASRGTNCTSVHFKWLASSPVLHALGHYANVPFPSQQTPLLPVCNQTRLCTVAFKCFFRKWKTTIIVRAGGMRWEWRLGGRVHYIQGSSFIYHSRLNNEFSNGAGRTGLFIFSTHIQLNAIKKCKRIQYYARRSHLDHNNPGGHSLTLLHERSSADMRFLHPQGSQQYPRVLIELFTIDKALFRVLPLCLSSGSCPQHHRRTKSGLITWSRFCTDESLLAMQNIWFNISIFHHGLTAKRVNNTLQFSPNSVFFIQYANISEFKPC